MFPVFIICNMLSVYTLWMRLLLHRKPAFFYINLNLTLNYHPAMLVETNSPLLLSISSPQSTVQSYQGHNYCGSIWDYLKLFGHLYTLIYCGNSLLCAIFPSGLMIPLFLYHLWNSTVWNQVSESGSSCTQVQPSSLELCHHPLFCHRAKQKPQLFP